MLLRKNVNITIDRVQVVSSCQWIKPVVYYNDPLFGLKSNLSTTFEPRYSTYSNYRYQNRKYLIILMEIVPSIIVSQLCANSLDNFLSQLH